MAKCTAVIDIGSNSMRMAVFQKTSRFAFHIIHEVKSSVRLGENAYANGGALQPKAMERTAAALGEFLSVARSFDARKVLCVATSALRDAPNASEFLSRIRHEHGLSIKVIDGETEAYLGGIACANLLPRMDAVTVDVGGGSSEFALLRNGKIEQLVSLNVGTVRIKELFLDRNDVGGAVRYIDEALERLPDFGPSTLFGIGGTFRALTRSLMKKEAYPLKKLHGYGCSAERFTGFCDQIQNASFKKLKSLYIKPDRYDTIKAGALILQRIIRRLQSTTLVSSGVGVREGVYLNDLLRNSNALFPANYNPSVRYLLDTFAVHSDHGVECSHLAKRIFDLVHERLGVARSYRSDLAIAAKLLPIGVGIRYYAYQHHTHYLVINALDYALTHPQIALISHLLFFKKGRSASSLIPKTMRPLLPDPNTFNTLSNILWLSHILLSQRRHASSVSVELAGEELIVTGEHLYLAKEQMRNVILVPNLHLSIRSPR